MSRGGTARPVPTTTLLLRNIQRLVTLSADLGEIDDAAVFVRGNVIQWVGTTADLPEEFSEADTVLVMQNRVVLPGNPYHPILT